MKILNKRRKKASSLFLFNFQQNIFFSIKYFLNLQMFLFFFSETAD